ncbi:hypothetical protein [Glutamicibacter arilaitensis]|uniref:hypothetical protein n=1 Tax=Glutamicibacter arilaitensis TaxID=256701 RepID=UPI00384F4D5E
MKKFATFVSAASLVLASSLVSSCSRDDLCLPAPLAVSSPGVEAGSTLTVSAPPATCDLGYAAGKTYILDLIPENQNPGMQDLKAQYVRVNADGSFSADIMVPVALPPGDATVLVAGSPLDDCGTSGSCAAYSIAFKIE